MVQLPANTIEVIELIMSTLNMLTASVEELSRAALVSYTGRGTHTRSTPKVFPIMFI